MFFFKQMISSRFFAPKENVVMKSSNIDFVTETDQQVEKHLMDGITAKFPSHKFIGEEETSEGKAAELTDAPTWIIDVCPFLIISERNFI